jgi:hypothetical protein
MATRPSPPAFGPAASTGAALPPYDADTKNYEMGWKMHPQQHPAVERRVLREVERLPVSFLPNGLTEIRNAGKAR